MKRIYINTIGLCIILAATTLVTGCKKLIETPPPVTLLITESVFSNNNTATAAQTGIYATMFLNGCSQLIEVSTGFSADELTSYSTNSTTLNTYRNSLTADIDAKTLASRFWNPFYNLIYQENAIIEGLKGSTGIGNSVKKQLTGEAEFTRALLYFNLVNLYGDVPLVTGTDFHVNNELPRSSKDQVYQQMIADLIDAQSLLNTDFVDITDTVSTTERVRPTKAAANALLARVYLFKDDYPNAENAANLVINNMKFNLEPDLNKVFNKNSAEAIFQLMIPPGYNYTLDGNFFILYAAPTNQAISNGLLNMFEPLDSRKASWVKSITVTGNTYYFPFKYKAGSQSTAQTEYNMVLRLAEQYLIRAEARARQDKIDGVDGAVADLNVIRRRANLSDYSGLRDKASVLKAIIKERQAELFCEWGDRWFTLKRTNTINDVMSVVTPQKGGTGWQPYQALYPIPAAEIINNPNLTQTLGY